MVEVGELPDIQAKWDPPLMYSSGIRHPLSHTHITCSVGAPRYPSSLRCALSDRLLRLVFLDVVLSAGGRFCKTLPKASKADVTIIISCPEDAHLYKRYVKSGFSVVSKEYLLTGLLKHQLDVNQFGLS